MEIERKYLIYELPQSVLEHEAHEISQGYISNEPVVRIRRNDDRYILTIKSSGMIERIEVEKDLSPEEYSELSTMVKGNLIEKTRYKVPFLDYTLEIDVFHGIYEGLIYGEVEFPSLEEAESFIPPEYFGEDVSERPEFFNSALSTMDETEIPEFIKKNMNHVESSFPAFLIKRYSINDMARFIEDEEIRTDVASYGSELGEEGRFILKLIGAPEAVEVLVEAETEKICKDFHERFYQILKQNKYTM